jgi:hypothetical protein
VRPVRPSRDVPARGIKNMRKRTLIVTGWLTLLSALVAMIIGHSGDHDLKWTINQISTYAANAPHDQWITASMLLSCFTMVLVSLIVSNKILGDNWLTHIVPLFVGAAIAGLLTLASYKETARSVKILPSSGFEAIRQQSFHDAGLLIFFYSATALAVVLGILIIAQASGWKEKIIGGAAALLGLAAFPLMTSAWPGLMGLLSTGPGLKQRASLLSLWLASLLVLAVASGKIFRPSQPPTRRG